MPIYMIEVAYTPESWAALIRKPQNRVEAIRPAIEKVGGKVINGFLSFGDFDAMLIVEYPDEITAAAFQIAAAAAGAVKSTKATPLMSIEDGIKAFHRAGELTLVPPLHT